MSSGNSSAEWTERLRRAIDTKLIPDTPQKRSQDISEILPEDMIDLPEIKEEKHVTLTAEVRYQIQHHLHFQMRH